MRVAYVLDVFPSVTQTFILREMLELKRTGIDILVGSFAREHGIVHPEVAALDAKVYYVPRPRNLGVLRLLFANVKALVSHPRTYLSGLLIASRKRNLYILKSLVRAGYLYVVLRDQAVEHLHAHFASGANVTAMFVAQMLGVTFSFTGHAVDLFVSPMLLCRSIAAASFVVTCSQYNKDHMLSVCHDSVIPLEEKIHVIRYGIGLSGFGRSEAAPSSTPPLILAVGRLVQKKGHDVLIQALGLLHNRGVPFECCIVGDGPLGRQLRELARRCDVEGKVELVPVASQDEIRRLYERSSLFALACRVADDGDRDGIPNVLIEAMAMELPVVSTFVSGIPELITPDREGMLVPPDSVEELADAIEDLLDDPVKRKELGLAAREKVSREFELRSNTDLLGALLRDIPSSDKVMSS